VLGCSETWYVTGAFGWRDTRPVEVAASTSVFTARVTGRMIADVVQEFRGKNRPSFGGTRPKTEGFPQLNGFIFNSLSG
jgi:hypothetical protein